MKYPIAIITYDPDAPEGCEMEVLIPAMATEFLSILTDFELRVVAAEASLRVRKALEMPPSPK